MALVALAVTLAGACAAARAGDPPHLGAVVVDAASGGVLHARGANRRVRPASLSKLMTVWLLLDGLRRGEVDDSARWPVSRRAASQPATRLGLASGGVLGVDVALDALLIASANDAAVVAAEAIAGSEADFVARMNEAARRIGLTRTRFANASGLPAPGQFTTARDMALLAHTLWQAYPGRRTRFARTGMTHAGRWIGTHNRLLVSYVGARGMKTGFTCRAGFHLVAVAERGARTLIGVVLGARTAGDRDRLMRRLLDRGFAKAAAPDAALTLVRLAEAPGQGDDAPVHGTVLARSCLVARGPSGWNIDVGVRKEQRDARRLAQEFIRARRKQLPGARAFVIPRFIGVDLYRGIVTGLTRARARDACLGYRREGGDCVIFGPEAAARQLEDVARVRALAAGRVPESARPVDAN